MNTEDFVKKAISIHGERYNYSLVDYKNNKTKVKIICSVHGVFEQTPSKHTNCSQGCKFCNKKYLFVEDVITKIKKYHGEEYDYSQVEYINSKSNIKLICKKHGVFYKRFSRLNTICHDCTYDSYKNIDFIEKSKIIHHNKYDYSQVIYKNSHTKVGIICPLHGIFEQTFNMHINRRQGCPRCVNKNKTTEIFINESKSIHGEKYDYSSVEYKTTMKKVKIICNVHGEFLKTPNKHLIGEGCPVCKESNGEREIRLLLESNNIKYKYQKRFKNCIYKKPLPFDFYLPDQNICIEYDGKQHFECVEYFGGEDEFELRKIKDEIKNEYCKKNNIRLIRIRYDEDTNKKLNNLI